jgi:hypothetical protein
LSTRAHGSSTGTMDLHPGSNSLSAFRTRRQRLRLLRLAVVFALLGCGSTQNRAIHQPALPPVQWESGTFSHLPLRGVGDLASYVEALPHPGSYTALTATRTTQIQAMFDAIHSAITDMIGADCRVNWCAAVDATGAAGYRLGRYYDTVSSRWFIVGEDAAGTGHAFFIINPEPRRDLIVEAPHVYATNAKLEGRTDTEAVLILRQTLGRALLINGADRCQGDPERAAGSCGGTFSSANVCPPGRDNRFRPSDVGHNTDNAFHVLHQKFNDVSASTRFVQLHGNGDDRLPSGGLSVSDGRTAPNASSLATRFVAAIQALPSGALVPSAVNDCATEPEILCGIRNVQGRYTNDPTADCNGTDTSKGGTCFFHLGTKDGIAVARRSAAGGDRRAPGDLPVLGDLRAPGAGHSKPVRSLRGDAVGPAVSRGDRFPSRRVRNRGLSRSG